MAEVKKSVRLANVAKELNIGTGTIVEHLTNHGFDIDNKPTTKLTEEMYAVLLSDFRDEKQTKEESEKVSIGTIRRGIEKINIDYTQTAPKQKSKDQDEVLIKNVAAFEKSTEEVDKSEEKEIKVKVVGKIDLEKLPSNKFKSKEKEEVVEVEDTTKDEQKESTEVIKASAEKLQGTTVVGKIDLPKAKSKKLVASSDEGSGSAKKKRKRKKRAKIVSVEENTLEAKKSFKEDKKGGKGKKSNEVSDKEVQEQVKQTLARLTDSSKSKGAKHRRAKRAEAKVKEEEEQIKQDEQKNIIQVTEFSTVSDLAKLIDVSVNDVISSCMELGILVSINQRLDAETLTVVADDFGFEVSFVSADMQESIIEEEDDADSLKERPPIVTVMGHVDHGKTSLLDYIRSTNVIAGESGGITQHVAAYEVKLENGKEITFIDTPGHEAFTAMRARGAKVTDLAIIVIAADDSVMPQTTEAINHAQAANVPMIFALNKIDKDGANPDAIKEQLSNQKILVEDWGGNFQCQDISAKTGTNIDKLLEKVLVEAELLELKANPDKRANGTVIEASMEKGKGVVSTILVQSGTLKVGDVVLAGPYSGKVKAMTDERDHKVKEAGPSTPVKLLGFNGIPQAGDKFNVMASEQEAKEVASRRLQIQREQSIRTHKHITLDEIGRRLAIGNFKELNLIVKGDVDGSIEALGDSLLKLSTDQIHLNVIHKSVGQISDSDVMLASASDAIIVGFQVRPSVSARKLAENEQVDIRLYSIIYDCINEIKDALEGMLDPDIEEKIVGNIEIREIFKITKVGTIAGCYVLDGKISRNTTIRVIRDGVVAYTGKLSSLKRFKDDVKEVASGYECGLSIENFNDIKVGDIIEGYEEVEVKKTL